MSEINTRLQEIREILARLTDEQADLYGMNLEEVAEKLGQSPQEMTYEQLKEYFPEGSRNPEVDELLRDKKAEAIKLNPNLSSRPTTYIANPDGTVKKF